jgi:hypothetical protein
MGYRSDVYTAIEFVDEATCDAWIVAAKLRSEPEMWREMFGHGERSADGRIVVIAHEGGKWYDDYADVKFFTETVEWTHEHFDCGYRFVRLGEEVDDIVDDYCEPKADWNDSLWDALQIHRAVDYGFRMTRSLNPVEDTQLTSQPESV